MRHAHERQHRRGGFGPRGFRDPRAFGRGRKAGRGDIRAAILELLSEQPMHGYQMIREISERSEGAWVPSPGSVYPTLQQLEDEELVRAEQPDGGGRRVYHLTDAGREQAATREGAAPWTEAALESDDDLTAIRDLAFGVMGATRQVVQAGSKDQVTQAQAILREARRSLYQLLAEGPDEPTAG